MNRHVVIFILCTALTTCAYAALPVTDGLFIELRADSLEGLQDGDLISTWIDTAQNDAADGTVGDVGRPLPEYKANVLNGKPVVRFNGSNALTSSEFVIDPNAGITMIAVCTGDQGSDSAERIGQLGPQNAAGGTNVAADVCTNSTNGSGFRMNNGAILSNDPNPITKGWHVAAWLAPQGAKYDQDLVLFVDGVKQSVVANNSNTLTFSETGNVLSVGGGYQANGQWQWGDFVTADLAIILVYNRVLTDEEVISLSAYLKTECLTQPPMPVTEGLIIDLRAETLKQQGLQDGDTVVSWMDIAQDDTADGTVMDVNNSDLPEFKANALNDNKPVVRFNGSDALTSYEFDINASAGITMVAVCTGDRTGAMAERIAQVGPLDAQGGTCIGADVCTNSTNGSGFRMNNGAILIPDPNPITTGWHIAIWQAPQGSAYADLIFYVDGVIQAITANNGNSLSLVDANNVVSVGNGYAAGGIWQRDDFCNADLAVLLVYNRVLTEDEVAILSAHLYEAYVAHENAINPEPANLGIVNSPSIALSWEPGDSATSHQVYLSTEEQEVVDANDVALVGTLAESNLAVEGLAPGTYYWRVDEVNETAIEPAITPGSVWMFSVIDPNNVINLLENGTFENGVSDPWVIWTGVQAEVVSELSGAAVAEGPVEGSFCLHLSVPTVGGNYYDRWIKHTGLVFQGGMKYTFSAFMKSNQGTFEILMKPENSSDYQGYNSLLVEVTEEWQEFSVTTDVFAGDIDPAAFTLIIGYAPGEIWIDNVRAYAGDYVAP
jgi:hypothetical protein